MQYHVQSVRAGPTVTCTGQGAAAHARDTVAARSNVLPFKENTIKVGFTPFFLSPTGQLKAGGVCY